MQKSMELLQILQNIWIKAFNSLKQTSQRTVQLLKTKKIAFMLPIAFILPVMVVFGAIYVKSTSGYLVNVSGEYSFIVKSPSQVNKIVDEIMEQEEADHNIIFNPQIEYSKVYFADGRLSEFSEIENALKKYIEVIPEPDKIYELVVNGRTFGLFEKLSEVNELFELVKRPYTKDDENCVISFLEDVEIEEVYLNGQIFSCVDEVYEKLISPEEEIVTYTVSKGDTLSQIADKHGLKTNEVLKANPEIKNEHTLSIGQEIFITLPRYPLNVVETRMVEYEDVVAYENIYEDDEEMYKGQTKVKEAGIEGSRIVKAQEISINGIYEETVVIDEEITREPVNAIVYRGMKERPRTLAYDEFIMPSRGSISSRFGQRWNSFHTGVDLASRRGTPNRAADGGKVIFAGWQGNYGKLIIIDHENGYTTYYAHNDTISVSVGERVARGDIIGTVGTTGNVTGPHLHFEIRKDGVPLDPMNFLK